MRSAGALCAAAAALLLCAAAIGALPQQRPLSADAPLIPSLLRSFIGGGIIDNVTCDMCLDAVALFQFMMAQNSSQMEFQKYFIELCDKVGKVTPDVCAGIVPEFRHEALTVLDEKFLNPHLLCEFVDICPSNRSFFEPQEHRRMPPPTRVALSGTPLLAPRRAGAPLKILHLSDLHFDSLYQVGSVIDCGRPLCCRAQFGPGNGTNAARKWGEYECDLNERLLDVAFQQIAALGPLDAIFWTGDNPPHDVWEQSREEQLNASLYLAEKLQAAFPKTVVLPALGNHESFPVNSFPVGAEAEWLYSALSSSWGKWLPPDTHDTMMTGMFYEVLLVPGVRVLSLNMNYCNTGNFWMLLNDTDPTGMLAWMNDVLFSAQQNGERVMLLGHIPPGHKTCLLTWGAKFQTLLQTYADSIIGSFMGHTHKDHWEMVYDASGKPINVVFIAPSLTPFTNINPSFRFYQLDSAARVLTGMQTYHVDLQDANEHDNPTFRLFYDAAAEYGLKSMEPEAWNELALAAATDNALFTTIYNNFHTGLDRSCDAACRKLFVCELQSSSFFSTIGCMGGAWDLESAASIVEDRLCY